EARKLEGEEGVAGGYAAAAGGDHFPLACAEPLVEGAQFRRGQEAAVAQIPRDGSVDRARDVAGARVDRLDLAAVPLRRAGIGEDRAALVDLAPRDRLDLGALGQTAAIEDEERPTDGA